MYYIIYVPLYLLSLLPLRVLYAISDFISFFLFRVFGYRRKIIEGNLAIAFPEKSIVERKIISHKFHRNFTDTFIETVKCLSVSKSFYEKHSTVDLTIEHEFARQGKSFQLHACHQFNWEWINMAWAAKCKQPVIGIYMPISSKPLEKLFFNLRTRFGTIMLPATNMKNSFVAWKNKPHSLVLVADQKPGNPSFCHWLNFFNKPTPFVTGPERNAFLKKCPVVFAKAKKIARGKYHTSLELATMDASLLNPGDLTIMYRDFIEAAIKDQPDMYLWSHKRFKFDWKDEYQDLWIDKKPVNT